MLGTSERLDMSEIKFGKSITLKQAANLIRTNPTTRFLLQGEPGIGKSSLLESIANGLGYDYAYIDVPNMDLGDIAMPVIDHETKTTRYYPNARFGIHTGKPMVIMLDEFTKGSIPLPIAHSIHCSASGLLIVTGTSRLRLCAFRLSPTPSVERLPVRKTMVVFGSSGMSPSLGFAFSSIG